METNQETEEKSTIAVKKSHILSFVGAAFMIAIFIFAAQAVVANTGGTQQNTNYITAQAAAGPVAPLQDGKQVVRLTIQGGTYYPNPVRVKKGVPVVLDVDTDSVRGCYRGIQIPAFGVRKVVSANDNKIEFTPDKAGTFGFSCLMGMGRGQLVVEDEAGNVPANVNTVKQDIPSGATCGTGGGGCGCGG